MWGKKNKSSGQDVPQGQFNTYEVFIDGYQYEAFSRNQSEAVGEAMRARKRKGRGKDKPKKIKAKKKK